MAFWQVVQGTGRRGDVREGRGEAQVSHSDAPMSRMAVMVERSRSMGEEGARGAVAKRPSWVVILGELGGREQDWRNGRVVDLTSRFGAESLRRELSSSRAAVAERSGSWVFQG